MPENTKTTKYEHIIPQLTAVEESDEIDGLLVLLNTPRGRCEAGLAIAELIAGMSKPTVSLVLGGGHSIGVPLAGGGAALIHRAVGVDDHPSRALDRHGHWRAPDAGEPAEDPAAHRGFYHVPFGRQ